MDEKGAKTAKNSKDMVERSFFDHINLMEIPLKECLKTESGTEQPVKPGLWEY